MLVNDNNTSSGKGTSRPNSVMGWKDDMREKPIYSTCVPNGGLVFVARRQNTLPGFCEFGAYADLHPDDAIRVLTVGTAKECYRIANGMARRLIKHSLPWNVDGIQDGV